MPSEAPSPRVGTESAILHDSIWIFSGRGGIAMDPIDEDGGLWRFTPSTLKWSAIKTETGPHPVARSYHTMTSDGQNKLCLHAGCPAEGRLPDLWVFDVESGAWSELPAAPGPARGGTSIAFYQEKLYRMNGFDGTKEQGGWLDIYDIGKRTWNSITYTADGESGPEPRSVATLLTVKTSDKRNILITMFGEHNPSALGHAGAGKMLNNVWAFDIDTEKWEKVTVGGDGDSPAPRGWFSADVRRQEGGDVVILHGGLAEDNSRLGDVWQLQFDREGKEATQ